MDNNNLYGTDNNNANPYENNVQTDKGMNSGMNDAYQQPYSTQPADNQPYANQPYNGQQPYQDYNNQQYGQQNYYAGAPEEPKKASGLAIASMVCGIVSIVICCVWYLAAPLAIAAIVLGIINNVKKLGGKGMAVAGIITGTCGLLLVIALCVVIIAGVASGDFAELMVN